MGSPGKPASTVDSDGDGLTDVEEAALGTDPNDADSDGDGLTDFQEVDIGTDPTDSDSDDDNLNDGEEVFGSLRVAPTFDFNQDGQVDAVEDTRDPARWDADGDGIVDPGEYVTNPNDPDTDDDGLSDVQEVYRLTDPKDPDTDDDGISDADDGQPGTDDYGPADPRPDDDAPPIPVGQAVQSRLSAILEARAPGPEGEIHSSGPEGVDEVAKVLEPQLPAVVGPRPGPRGLESKDDADGVGFGKGDTSSPPLEPALERDADFEAVDLPEPVELPTIDGDGSLPDDVGAATKTLAPEPEPAAADDPDGLPDA